MRLFSRCFPQHDRRKGRNYMKLWDVHRFQLSLLMFLQHFQRRSQIFLRCSDSGRLLVARFSQYEDFRFHHHGRRWCPAAAIDRSKARMLCNDSPNEHPSIQTVQSFLLDVYIYMHTYTIHTCIYMYLCFYVYIYRIIYIYILLLLLLLLLYYYYYYYYYYHYYYYYIDSSNMYVVNHAIY